MVAREVRADVYSVGAIDWDRRLFEELVPSGQVRSYPCSIEVDSTSIIT